MNDEFDDEIDELDEFDGDFDGDLDDDLDDFDENNGLSDTEVEMAGTLDGEFDGETGLPLYNQYGSSVDLSDLTDEQREIYDTAYDAGHDAAAKQL